MTNQYRAITWTPHKVRYDVTLAGGVIAYVAIFVLVGWIAQGERGFDATVTLIRATGTCAFVLLHLILCIGPLARLDKRWLPLLYNRRHLGVTTCLIGLLHAGAVTLYYHGASEMNPLVSLLVNTTRAGVGFEIFGIVSLVILLLLAVTSHDFWLHTLGSRAWKWLHMLVYIAYGLLVVHVAFGALQDQRGWLMTGAMLVGIVIVGALHIIAGVKETRSDHALVRPETETTGWIDAGPVDTLEDGRARLVRCDGGERVAVFRHDGMLSAVANVCAHQGGPLGEGRIVDGCITCPWHGYQYLPTSGQSSPPYTEKVPTYDVKIESGKVLVRCTPNAPGTETQPARISTGDSDIVREGPSP